MLLIIVGLVLLVIGFLCVRRYYFLLKNKKQKTEWKNFGIAIYITATIALILGILAFNKM